METRSINILETLGDLASESGIAMFLRDPLALVMVAVACLLIYLAIVKKFEPLLLLPIAFGMLLTNLLGSEVYHESLFAGGHANWSLFGGAILVLMPNPKSGTVTMDIARAVKDIKAGKVEYRLDKTAIIHCPIGKVSFGKEKLQENLNVLMEAINKAKPAAAKGTYMKSVYLSSTMGPAIRVNPLKF